MWAGRKKEKRGRRPPRAYLVGPLIWETEGRGGVLAQASVTKHHRVESWSRLKVLAKLFPRRPDAGVLPGSPHGRPSVCVSGS